MSEDKSTYNTRPAAELPAVHFSSNWNRKLDCRAFSTIRIRNDSKYKLNHDYSIILKQQPIYVATLVSIRHFSLDNLSDAMAYLDTGYSKKETIDIITKMYKHKNINVYHVEWSHLVFFHKMLSEQ